MYQINTSANELIELTSKRFTELGFKEREHLQEWIAKTPDVLGEELLIIQKEFAGFDETRERLDLLALDKTGGLVVIENKLDDSGRDVVWQALKYASYCSSLSKSQIRSIYQEYLDKHENGADAGDRICEFLEAEDFSEVILNTGSDQRIKLVAAHFRKEVTSTVLWLLQHGIGMECFKATIFQYGTDTLLNFEQIIPTPEAADFMVGISEKEKEQQSTERAKAGRETLRTEFWESILPALDVAGVTLYQNVSPSRDHWLSAGAGLSSVTYAMIFSHTEARVDFYMSRANRDENKQIFDWLHEQKEAIEADCGFPLEWQRLDQKKACRITYRKPFDGYNRDVWPEMVAWLVENIGRLEKAMRPRVVEIGKKLKKQAHTPTVEQGMDAPVTAGE